MKIKKYGVKLLAGILAVLMLCETPVYASGITEKQNTDPEISAEETIMEEPAEEPAAEVQETEEAEEETEEETEEEPSEEELVAAAPEETDPQDEGIEYVLGRPMTEEELEEQQRIRDEAMANNAYIPEMDDEGLDLYIPGSDSEISLDMLASKYDSRTNGYVTPVRNQNPYGTCWTFAMMAAVESDLLKGDFGTYDLSEAHLAFFSSHSANEPLNNQYNDYMVNNHSDKFYNFGGNSYMSYATLAAWRGAVSESDAPYSKIVNGFTRNTTWAYGKNKIHLTGFYRIDKNNANLIKQAIMDHGAVGASYMDSSSYYNANTASYYCNVSSSTNHAITIVGWDDNYAVSNFKSSCRPSSKGAWIVKNSWGTTWGKSGYFYISYADKTLNSFFAVDAEWVSKYDSCYQYDLTAAPGTGYTADLRRAAAVFTAKANPGKVEELTSVSIAMTTDTNVKYSIQIYKNPTDSSDPTSGTPMLSSPQTGITTLAGYYTIPLKEQPVLQQGERFAVVFTFSEGAKVDYETSYSNSGYVVTPSIRAKENFIDWYGNGWRDFSLSSKGNLRIKAVTRKTNEEAFYGSVRRIYGLDRYKTSIKTSYAVKAGYGSEKLNSILLASGTSFADALAGSYLAYKTKAPILMVDEKNSAAVKDYIQTNVNSGGTVYLLGGTGVVPDSVVSGLTGYTIRRLGDKDRYLTNIRILESAGLSSSDEQVMIVCTGFDFADSLSASATKHPILLVGKSLTQDQKTYLNKVKSSWPNVKFCVIGGPGIVDSSIETYLKKIGSVERIYGQDRYETSVKIAEKFFSGSKNAAVAYAKNYPDGLCGGALAVSNYFNGPLILTDDSKAEVANAYMSRAGIRYGVVLGGPGLISDESVVKIFRLGFKNQIKDWDYVYSY